MVPLLAEKRPKGLNGKDRSQVIFDYAIPFHVSEINPKGLVFHYIGSRQWFNNPVELDIVCDGFCLKKIPVQTISDCLIPIGVVQMRRHEVKFCQLTPSQFKQLDHFLH